MVYTVVITTKVIIPFFQALSHKSKCKLVISQVHKRAILIALKGCGGLNHEAISVSVTAEQSKLSSKEIFKIIGHLISSNLSCLVNWFV